MKLKLLLSTMVIVAFGIFSSAQSTINITTTLNGCCATEKWVSITDMADGAGTQIWGQGDGTYGNAQGLINQDIMLAPGTYWVNCYDRYADSWDGTTIDVTAYGASIGNNGGVSPDDGTNNDAGSGWETPADELEASFMIVVPSPPACTVPTAIVSSNITAASADFSWIASASEIGGYNWEVVPQGDAQGVNVVSSGTTVSGALTVSASGLSSATPYDFYISTDCGATGMSTWAGPITFTTLCAVITPDYNADMSINVPTCWEEANNGDAASGPADLGSSTWTASNHNGSPSNRINMWQATRSDWIISPTFDLSMAAPSELNVYVALTESSTNGAGADLGSDDRVSLLMTIDNGATWTEMQAWIQGTVPTDIGEEITYDLSAITGNVRFAFLGDEGSVDDPEDVYFHVSKFQLRETPSCPDTSNLTLASNTDVTATINFDSGNAMSAGNYEYSLTTVAGATPVVSGAWSDVAGATPNVTYTITGLTAETEYFVHVREVCAVGDESVWSPVPVNFTTACTTLIAPYTQDFENAGAVPNCWTLGGDDDWEFNLTGPNHVGNGGTLSGSTASGNYYAALDDSSPDAVDGQLNSPLVDVSGLSSPALSFYEISDNEGNANATLTVSVWDGAAWNVMGTYNTNTAGWELKVIDLSTLTFTGAAQARFSIADSGSFYDDIAIDDVSFNELPTCSNVNAVTVDSVTGDSATLSWTENNIPAGTAWEVIAVPAGDPAPAVGTTNATAIPYTVTGLASSTAYDIYVRADCSTTFVGPLGVTTSAACGDTVYDAGGVLGDYSNSESYTITYLPDTAANVVTLDFTLVDIENCCDTLTIYDGLDTSAAVLEADLENPAVFSALNPAGAITIEFTSDSSVAGAGWEANYTCTPRPSCVDVTAVSLQIAGPDSLTLSWSENNIPAGTAWEVVAVPAGDPAPVAGTTNATAIPYTVTGLASETAYDVYVRADCSTSFVGPLTVTTSCTTIVPDALETFDTFVPDCWEEAADGDLTTGPTGFGSGDWGAEEFAHSSTSGGGAVNINLYRNVASDWIVSPLYDLSAGGYELNIDVAVTNYNSTGADNMGSDDLVVLAYTTDGTTWTALQTWDVNNQPATAGETYNDALTGINSATVRFGIYATDGAIDDAGVDYDFHIDNFQIRTPPACPDTSNLTLASNTDVTATINFDSGNATSAGNYEYSLTTVAGTAPAVSGSWSDVAGATPNVTYTIMGLTAETEYFVHVREVCAVGDESAWSLTPLNFTTSCAVVSSFPYTTDFTNNAPNACWDEAGSGEIVDGPMTVGSSDWRSNRSYEDFSGTVIPSNAINLYNNNDREWLLSEQYDMTGTSNDVLSIEVAVTNWNSVTAPDVMGSDDQVDLLITNDAGMTWTSLMTWTAANQPAVDGTRAFIDLSSYTGTVQFAFFASDGTVDDSEDYDFHVGMFIIDGTAGNEDVFESTLSLYPNPVNGDVVTISMDQTNASSIEVAVFNTLGQQVMTRSFDQVNHTINIDNISSLSQGMYFVKLSSGTQQATLKFIKE